MKKLSRRTFLTGTAAAGAITLLARRASAEAAAPAASQAVAPAAGQAVAPAAGPAVAPAAGDDDVPRVDYHVHLDVLGIDKAVEVSKAKGVKFGIVEHAGTKENKYPVVLSNDEELKKYIAMLEGKPVFKGVQAECIDWMTVFSKDAVAQLDYVLSDALTFVEKDGSRVELWKKEKVHVTDKQDFMERYTDFNVRKISEPIDILANPTYLPAVLQPEFDALWTPERMRRVIDAAVKYHVAIEISSSFRLPRLAFLKMAKEAGVKFSFGSNGRRDTDVGKLDYCLEMVKALGLKRGDIFTPAPAGRKPIQVR